MPTSARDGRAFSGRSFDSLAASIAFVIGETCRALDQVFEPDAIALATIRLVWSRREHDIARHIGLSQKCLKGEYATNQYRAR
jgi:hypothetical protein